MRNAPSSTHPPHAPQPDAARDGSVDGSVDAAADRERRLDVVQRFDALIAGRVDRPDDAAAVLLQRWRRLGTPALLVEPTELRVGDTVAATIGVEADARWWLVASAGAAAWAPEVHATPADVLAMARRIAALSPRRSALMAFRRHLWMASDLGWIVALRPPAWHVALRSGVGVPDRGEVDASRQAAVARLQGLATATPVATNEAAANQDAGRGAPRALRLGVDDAAFWLDAERAVLDRDADLRGRLAPPQHAGWVQRANRDGPTLRLGPSLARMHRDGGAWSQGLDRLLAPRVLAREIARRVRIDAPNLAEIETMLIAGDGWAGGLASGLLERGRGDERSLQALHAIVTRFGLDKLWELASLDGIDEPAARSLALILRQHDAAPQLWVDLVGVAPARVAAWILSSAPPALLNRFGPPLRRSLRERSAEDSAPLIEALLRAGTADAIRVVTEALVESRGVGWAGRLVPEVCNEAVRQGLGRSMLVPLFLNRDADVKLRLLILRSLQGDPAALEEAVKFRVTEVMEPRELQERIKAARKGAKG